MFDGDTEPHLTRIDECTCVPFPPAAMRARLGFVAAGVGATSSLLVPSSFVFTESESTFRVRETSRAGATSGETAEGHGAAVVFAPAPPPKTHPNAKLVFVQVLTRHGDRTSINPLPSESKQQWRGFLLDDSADAHLAKFAAPSPVNPKLLDTRRTDMYGTDTSWHGQLTTQGEAQLRATGASIRKWLVESDAHGARSLLPVSSRLAFEQGVSTHRAIRAGAGFGVVSIRTRNRRRFIPGDASDPSPRPFQGIHVPQPGHGVRSAGTALGVSQIQTHCFTEAGDCLYIHRPIND